jgi:hypothetical protein
MSKRLHFNSRRRSAAARARRRPPAGEAAAHLVGERAPAATAGLRGEASIACFSQSRYGLGELRFHAGGDADATWVFIVCRVHIVSFTPNRAGASSADRSGTT